MWTLFATLAALCWAIANIIDKTVLTKWVKRPLVPIIITGTIWFLLGFIVFFTQDFSFLPFPKNFLGVLTGLISVGSWLFYFKAMQIGEASRVVPLNNLSKLFVVILATVFLGEILTPLNYLGIFLLVIGAILISANNFSKVSLGKAFWYIMLIAIFYSINSTLSKYLLNSANYWTLFVHRSLGMFLGSIPIMFLYFPELLKTVKQHGKKVLVFISASELITATGILLSMAAASIGYISLVSALSSLQPFFVLLFTVFLSTFFPSILKEEISKSIIFIKIVAILLIFAGVILIT